MMVILALLLCVLLASCGGSSSAPGPGPIPTNPNTITISPSGVVSTAELVVAPGARVTFLNRDSRRHDMTSDPHPDHTDCPEINQVGVLNPGQSRETGNLVAVRSCGYHDHDNPDTASLRGRIVVR
jgi:plastocyanin